MVVPQRTANAARSSSAGSDFRKAFRSMPQNLHQKVCRRQHQSVSGGESTSRMDLKSVRRANLKRLLKARGLEVRDLPARYGRTYSYWRDLLEDSAKSFGEKAARKIEDQFNLPSGSLDIIQGRATPAHSVSQSTDTMPPHLFSWGDLKMKEPEKLPAEFRVVLDDDAMAPEACAGWRIELSKALEPRFGDDVLVRLGTGDYHYRRYRQNPAGGWSAAALHSDFATFDSLKDPAMKIIAVMAFVMRPRRA